MTDRPLRGEAWRADPAAYALQDSIRPRFADVDPLLHLNNVALVSIHQEACQLLLRGIIGDRAWRQGRPLIASTSSSTEYLGEAFYPGAVEIAAGLTWVDARQIGIATALFQRGRCIGLHQAWYACWDENGPIDLPTDLQAAFRAAATRLTGRAPPPRPAAPPAASSFAWHSQIRSRFADRDARDVLGDVALARYAEHIRSEMFFEATRDLPVDQRLRAVVARVDLAFERRARPPISWEVGGAVTRVGDRSVSVRGALYADGVCQAVSDAVIVVTSAAAHGKAGIPAPLREALQRLASGPA